MKQSDYYLIPTAKDLLREMEESADRQALPDKAFTECTQLVIGPIVSSLRQIMRDHENEDLAFVALTVSEFTFTNLRQGNLILLLTDAEFCRIMFSVTNRLIESGYKVNTGKMFRIRADERVFPMSVGILSAPKPPTQEELMRQRKQQEPKSLDPRLLGVNDSYRRRNGRVGEQYGGSSGGGLSGTTVTLTESQALGILTTAGAPMGISLAGGSANSPATTNAESLSVLDHLPSSRDYEDEDGNEVPF